MKRIHALTLIGLFLLIVSIMGASAFRQQESVPGADWWDFQSIDTMKYSRDASREKLSDPSFDDVIRTQVKNIADTGATHVGIATPYDEEFVPILKRWVAAARQQNLFVWFRGNWSGWERWFGYEPITRAQHITKTREFILTHPELFADGDVFSGCPECENGGPGNPQITGDAAGYRKFLMDEYQVTKEAFAQIGKRVASNYFSMNGDVAKLIMDKPTTAALDGIVTIDHYVASPDRLVNDIRSLAAQSGGRVVLGEFGAPIPDIHGVMDEEAQARYLDETFRKLASVTELVGINYWVNTGGSTKLWNEDGSPRKAVATLTKFFSPSIVTGRVRNEIGKPIANATIQIGAQTALANPSGQFTLIRLADDFSVSASAAGYTQSVRPIDKNTKNLKIVLLKTDESVWFSAAKIIRKILFFLP